MKRGQKAGGEHGDKFQNMLATKAGLRWLGEHPEAERANMLAAMLLVDCDLLADPDADPAKRAIACNRVTSVWRAYHGFADAHGTSTDRHKALRRALDAASVPHDESALAALPATSRARVIRQSRITLFKVTFGEVDVEVMHRADIDDAVLKAIATWKKRGRGANKWQRANELAMKLGCGCDSGEALRKAVERSSDLS